MVLKTDTSSLTTTQHGAAIFSIPGASVSKHSLNYIHNTYEEADIACNKEK